MDHPDVSLLDFKVQNIIGSCDLGCRLNVEELQLAFPLHCVYEPELYPALVYQMDAKAAPSKCIKVLIFPSGKLVMTGSKVRLPHLHPCTSRALL
jgi:transcription initiation factor TFIID TATA-box-binding protein